MAKIFTNDLIMRKLGVGVNICKQHKITIHSQINIICQLKGVSFFLSGHYILNMTMSDDRD